MERRRRQVWALVMRDSATSLAVARGILRHVREDPAWHVHFGLIAPLELHRGAPRPDAVVTHVYNGAMMAFVRSLRCPVVDLSDVFFTTPLPRVLPDDEAIGREAARHLLGLGLQELAAVGYAPWHYSRRRMDGFGKEVERSGLRRRDFGQLHPNLSLPGASPLRACPGLAAWLKSLPLPCGLFVTLDSSAAYCMACCQELGLSVPASVAILGVNNDELVCEGAVPTLTSVDPNWERVGYAAARVAAGLLDGRAPSRLTLVPPQGVVARQSTDTVNVPNLLVRRAISHIRGGPHEVTGVRDVAEALAVSRRQLERQFRSSRRGTVLQEILNARVQRVCHLLTRTELLVKEIAPAAGFSSPTHCLMAFRRIVGCSPSEYRRTHRTHTAGETPRA